MFSGAHHLFSLVGVDLGWAGDDDRLEPRLLQALRQVRRPVGNLPGFRELLGSGRSAAAERDDLDVGDVLDRLHVLGAEGAITCDRNLHWFCSEAYVRAVSRCCTHDCADVSRVWSTTIVGGPVSQPLAILSTHR